ncbi:MAG: inorganic phosphate transporter [Campylobacteraceae bacterium]|nr:inorganic phosphate transporter [Campylobacteraceae bacterium]
MLTSILVFSTIFLAYNNGANDNFKGVATLYGSGTLGFKTALTIATITTFLGSITAIFVANGLIQSFSGKGLVPQEIAGSVDFLIAVGFGAGFTVLLATRLGFPVSTTHSLVGGLMGAGLMAVGMEINFSNLGSAFFIPLLVSPFLAFALGMIAYLFFKNIKKSFGLTKETCVCIGAKKQYVPVEALNNMQMKSVALSLNIKTFDNLQVQISKHEECVQVYTNNVFGFSVQKVLDGAHILSAAAVSFARGLNDTPKIAGLLVAAQGFDIKYGMIAIAVGMAIGGLLNSRLVAQTMSKKITKLSHGQGLCANLVTSFLVIVASKFGIPVSTTHVSVGSIFGIGMISKNYNSKVIRSILLSWVVTLPIGMFFSAICYFIVKNL